MVLCNPNPVVYKRKARCVRNAPTVVDEYEEEPINQMEIFDHIRDIVDPEAPRSLEELKVVTKDSIEVNDKQSYVRVSFTPTNKHCHMTHTIGLCIYVKLIRSLPARYKIHVRVAPGMHATEAAYNKLLNDKERVTAALEIPDIAEKVDSCLEPTFA